MTRAFVEDLNWFDKGCNLYKACLSCPRDICKEDVTDSTSPSGRQILYGEKQQDKVAHLRAEKPHLSREALAAELGMSLRTVYRHLARIDKDTNTSYTTNRGKAGEPTPSTMEQGKS